MLERFQIRSIGRIEAADGQTFVEYALILAAVVVGVLVAASWTGIGSAIQAAISAVGAAM
jgi:Flp pilus assembly pilin Flp